MANRQAKPYIGTSGFSYDKWLGAGKTVYAFFNNDADGFAPFDAKLLKDMVKK